MYEQSAHLAFTGIVVVATAYVACAYLLRFVMIVCAWRETARQRRYRFAESPDAAVESGELPRISIIVPAYNEEASIVRTVRSLLSQSYPAFEVVIVSDGSTDRTLGVLMSEFDLVPTDVPQAADIPAQAV